MWRGSGHANQINVTCLFKPPPLPPPKCATQVSTSTVQGSTSGCPCRLLVFVMIPVEVLRSMAVLDDTSSHLPHSARFVPGGLSHRCSRVTYAQHQQGDIVLN